MAAPAANTNATKWTEETTIAKLDLIEGIALSGRVLTLGSALVAVRLYQGVWNYWKKRWADHEDIMDRIYYIEQIYINALVEGGLTRRLHSGQSMFILRQNYGYAESTARREEVQEQVPPLLEQADTVEKEAADLQNTVLPHPHSSPLEIVADDEIVNTTSSGPTHQQHTTDTANPIKVAA